MLNFKNKVIACFNNAANTYDNNCSVQLEVGLELINKLLLLTPTYNNIIDLGCGTGIVTKKLSERFPEANIHAIDIACHLLKIAQNRLAENNVNVYERDFDNLSKAQFELAFANMSLQWSVFLPKSFISIRNSLKENGILAFSLPLIGTFSELPKESKMEFLEQRDTLKLLEQAGFINIYTSVSIIRLEFPSFLTALKSIKAAGANALKSNSSSLLKFKDHQNSFFLTYKIGLFIAKKI